MFLNSFFYFALKFRSIFLTLNSIKRTTRFYTTILIHLYTKKSFFLVRRQRTITKKRRIDRRSPYPVATALHDLATSTFAAIVVDRFVLCTRLGFKAFEPRVDFPKLEELSATFHEETIELLVRNVEPADYPFARSNETVGGVTKELSVVG